MNIIKPEMKKADFKKWYFSRINTKLGLLACLFVVGVGFLLVALGYLLHGQFLLDVLLLFCLLGGIGGLLILIAPSYTYKKFYNRELVFEFELKIFDKGILVKQCPYEKIHLIYNIIEEVLVINLRGLKSISVYNPTKDEVADIKEKLRGTGIKMIEGKSFLDIAMRNSHVFKL